MRNPLLAILNAGLVTQRELFPELPEAASGLPMVSEAPCESAACGRCVEVCPTQAISVTEDRAGGVVALDRGRCIGCSGCIEACPSGTLVPDRSTLTATRTREELVLTNRRTTNDERPTQNDEGRGADHGSLVVRRSSFVGRDDLFRRSLHIREVSTGCNATDLEVAATTNPIFDVARFGVHFVASPRFADALLVTGPVGRAMHEPLRRCYEAMAEPRLVIAVGTCAVSGGLHRGGYADANGVTGLLPIAAYVPGCPPHPWSIIQGILLAMGREAHLSPAGASAGRRAVSRGGSRSRRSVPHR